MRTLLYATLSVVLSLSASAQRESTDDELDTQMELVHLEVTVARIELPQQFGRVLELLDAKRNLSWVYTTSLSCGDWQVTQVVYRVVSPRLKDKGYYVLLEGGKDLDDANSARQITRIGIGYREPINHTLYFADLTEHRAIEKQQRRANKSVDSTPSAGTSTTDQPRDKAPLDGHR